MEAYRDQYATLFNNGRNVVVLGISVDPDTTLAAWAASSAFPIMFLSDADASVSRQYKVYSEENKMDSRHLYVIDRDGRITYKVQPFRVLAQESYADLATEIKRLNPVKEGPP